MSEPLEVDLDALFEQQRMDRFSNNAAMFEKLVNRREFRESRNSFMRDMQARVFVAFGYPEKFAHLALRF